MFLTCPQSADRVLRCELISHCEGILILGYITAKTKKQQFHDLTGRRFGRLTVLNTFTAKKWGGFISFSNCICDCGKSKTIRNLLLKNNTTRSCGCYRSDYRKHQTNRKHYLYNTWAAIKTRCYNPNVKNYSDYGGRKNNPIKMFSEWKNSFITFRNYILTNLGEKPSPEHSLDRIKNNKGYYPGNIRWATRIQQQRNTTRNIYVTYKGITLLLKDWASKTGMPYCVLLGRHRCKWPIETMLAKPTRSRIHRVITVPDLSWITEYSQHEP